MAKNLQKLRNPFVYQGYVSPAYFCDRSEETEELIANLQNGRNTVLISPRRIGKTGLIKNTFYHILEQEKDAKCLYLDIFATKNQSKAAVASVEICDAKSFSPCSLFAAGIIYVMQGVPYQSTSRACASMRFSVLSSKAGKKSMPVRRSISSTVRTA